SLVGPIQIAAMKPVAASARWPLLQLRLVELFPIIQIIKVYCILAGRGVIRQRIGAKDALASVIIVIVTPNGRIKFLDGGLVELRAGLFHPGLELAISRAAVFNEMEDRVTLEPQPVDNHLIVSFARPGITRRKFAARFQRGLEPQTWQMQHAERPGDSGTDEGNDFIHNSCDSLFAVF